MQQQINDNHDEARKGLDEQHVLFVRFENDFDAYKKKMVAVAEEDGPDDGGFQGGGGGGKASKQSNKKQDKFNANIQERVEGLDREVQRLARIDVRLNKELV